jgi:hypothetical protein
MFVAGVVVAGSLAAGATGAGTGIASADPPPRGPGHDHDNDGRDNNGQWGPPGDQWGLQGQLGPNDYAPRAYPPPPPPWAPTAHVFWDPMRQAWGFFWAS